MLFQVDLVTDLHSILSSRFQVHPTEMNLKELLQTGLQGKAGSKQYCFMSLFNDWVAEFTSTEVPYFRHEHLFLVNDDMHSNLL